jgi:hypothetical protein
MICFWTLLIGALFGGDETIQLKSNSVMGWIYPKLRMIMQEKLILRI